MRGSICWCVRGLAVPCNTTHFTAGVMPCAVTTRPAPVRAFSGGLRSIASCYRRRVWRFSQHFPLICLTREGGSTAPCLGGSWWPFHLSEVGSNAAVAACTVSSGSVGGETNLRKNCMNMRNSEPEPAHRRERGVSGAWNGTASAALRPRRVRLPSP